jgi:hypothetical protein
MEEPPKVLFSPLTFDLSKNVIIVAEGSVQFVLRFGAAAVHSAFGGGGGGLSWTGTERLVGGGGENS